MTLSCFRLCHRELFCLQSNRTGRNDMMDDHLVALDHDSVHYQLQNLLPGLERRIF